MINRVGLKRFSNYLRAQVTRREPAAIGVLAILITCILALGMLGFLIGPFDFDHLSAYYELAWRFWHDSLFSGRPSLPQYNPYLCGGRTLGADPQLPVLHPLAFLVPLLGPVWLFKLELLAQVLFGAWGMYRLSRLLGFAEETLSLGMLLFLGGGAVVSRILVGHVPLGYVFLWPWILYLGMRLDTSRGRETSRLLLCYAALFAYCSWYKPNFLIYGLPLIAVEAFGRGVARRSIRPIAYVAIASGFAALVAFASLWPASIYFREFPRSSGERPLWSYWNGLLVNVLMPLKAIPKAWYGDDVHMRHEYNLFVGPFAVFLAFFGVREAWKRHRTAVISLGLAAIVGALLGFGPRPDNYLGVWLYGLFVDFWPGFSSVRVPVRLWLGVFFFFVLMAPFGWRRFADRKAFRIAYLLLAVLPLAGVGVINITKTATHQHGNQFVERRYPHVDGHPWIEHVNLDNPDHPYKAARWGKGSINCVENLEQLRAPGVHPGALLPSPEAIGGKARLYWISWNRFEVASSAPEEIRIPLNFNHHPYWKVEGTGFSIVSNPGEVLTIAKAASTGESKAEVRFEQKGVVVGFLGMLAGLAGLLAWALWNRKRPPAKRVMLTGGAGTGKSVVAKQLRDAGIDVIDFDEVARNLRTEESFQLDVKKLGAPTEPTAMREWIFSNDNNRERFEQLLHPKMRDAFEMRVAALEKQGKRIVVAEAALAIETGYADAFDEVILLTSTPERQAGRLATRKARAGAETVAAQWTNARKMPYADVVIANDDSSNELHADVQSRVLDQWKIRGWI